MRPTGLTGITLTLLASGACTDMAAPRAGYEEIGVLQLVQYTGPRTVGADESVQWSVVPDTDVLAPPRLIVAPDTVDANVAFDVTVSTIGRSGCWRAAGQTLVEHERVIELTPVDVHSGARACTSIIQFLERTSRVRLESPGLWTVRVKGRRLPYQDGAWEEHVTAERTIVAR